MLVGILCLGIALFAGGAALIGVAEAISPPKVSDPRLTRGGRIGCAIITAPFALLFFYLGMILVESGLKRL